MPVEGGAHREQAEAERFARPIGGFRTDGRGTDDEAGADSVAEYFADANFRLLQRAPVEAGRAAAGGDGAGDFKRGGVARGDGLEAIGDAVAFALLVDERIGEGAGQRVGVGVAAEDAAEPVGAGFGGGGSLVLFADDEAAESVARLAAGKERRRIGLRLATGDGEGAAVVHLGAGEIALLRVDVGGKAQHLGFGGESLHGVVEPLGGQIAALCHGRADGGGVVVHAGAGEAPLFVGGKRLLRIA